MLHRQRPPLLLALVCLAGFAVTGLLAYLSPVARWSDGATLQGFTELNRPRLTPLIDWVAHLADPGPYAIAGLALMAVAALRRRPYVVVAIPVVMFMTGLTAETLKPLLAQPRVEGWLGDGQISAASWPSGHASAAMALALMAVLAAPARLRPTAAAVGAAFAVAVAYAILALGWHFPSDVLGGFLNAATWTLLAVAAINYAEARRPTRARSEAHASRRDLWPALGLAAWFAVLAGWAALERPAEALQFATDHTTFVAGAAAIGALGVALAALLAAGTASGPPKYRG